MANYQDLKDRLDRGEVIVLDGAVGTQLQAMGAEKDILVCISADSWSCYTHWRLPGLSFIFRPD